MSAPLPLRIPTTVGELNEFIKNTPSVKTKMKLQGLVDIVVNTIENIVYGSEILAEVPLPTDQQRNARKQALLLIVTQQRQQQREHFERQQVAIQFPSRDGYASGGVLPALAPVPAPALAPVLVPVVHPDDQEVRITQRMMNKYMKFMQAFIDWRNEREQRHAADRSSIRSVPSYLAKPKTIPTSEGLIPYTEEQKITNGKITTFLKAMEKRLADMKVEGRMAVDMASMCMSDEFIRQLYLDYTSIEENHPTTFDDFNAVFQKLYNRTVVGYNKRGLRKIAITAMIDSIDEGKESITKAVKSKNKQVFKSLVEYFFALYKDKEDDPDITLEEFTSIIEEIFVKGSKYGGGKISHKNKRFKSNKQSKKQSKKRSKKQSKKRSKTLKK